MKGSLRSSVMCQHCLGLPFQTPIYVRSGIRRFSAKIAVIGTARPSGGHASPTHGWRTCSSSAGVRAPPPAKPIAELRQLNEAAAALFQQGEFLRAIHEWEALITFAAPSVSPDAKNDPAVVSLHLGCLQNLACCYGEIGDHGKKLEILLETQQIIRHVDGVKSAPYAMVLYNLAAAEGDLGYYHKMKTLLEESLQLHVTLFGDRSPKVGRVLLLLASALDYLEEHNRQLAVAKDAFAIIESHCGKQHIQTSIALLTLARAHGQLGNHSENILLTQRALEMQEKQLGVHHPQLAVTLLAVADAYRATEEHFLRKECIERSIEIQQRCFGSRHANLITAFTELGHAYGALKEPKHQVPCYEHAFMIASERYGTGHVQFGMASLNCAEGCLEAHIFDKALSYQQRSTFTLEKSLPPNHPALLRLKALGEEILKNTPIVSPSS